MASYSDEELTAMMTDLESDLVERKESLNGDARTKIRQAACAMANDLPDHRRLGVIMIGVSDAGLPTGLPITDKLLLSLADVKTDGNIVPPPTLTVAKHELSGVDVAVLSVHPSVPRSDTTAACGSASALVAPSRRHRTSAS